MIRNMKTHCPRCGAAFGVSEDEILDRINRSKTLRSKVASMLGKMTGGKTTLDADGRRKRALKAVRAREAKRNKGK